MDYAQLAKTPLFEGASADDIATMAACLGARERSYPKGSFVYRRGDTTREMGVVLSGAVRVERTDLWGATTVLSHAAAGETFAEAYACIAGEPMLVDVIAVEDAAIAFLDVGRIAAPCCEGCACHRAAATNLLAILARKNLGLSRRAFHVAPKTIRGKLLSYLSDQAALAESRSFDIPFDRQELADYLGVDRSALSAELGRMRDDGLLSTRKSHFDLRGA